jgi:hypothetical protein
VLAMPSRADHAQGMATYEIGLSGLCELLLSGRANLSICSRGQRLCLLLGGECLEAKKTYQARECPRGPG